MCYYATRGTWRLRRLCLGHAKVRLRLSIEASKWIRVSASDRPIPLLEPCFEGLMRLEKPRGFLASVVRH